MIETMSLDDMREYLGQDQFPRILMTSGKNKQ